MVRNVQLLVTPDCPHADPARDRIRESAEWLETPITIDRIEVDDVERAEWLDFPGSPTLRIGGRDLEAPLSDPDAPPAIACRMYGPEGVPPRWMVESALVRPLDLERLVFLCVANSARSQIAEGLAEAVADDLGRELEVQSAGSSPGSLRDGARTVLQEVDVETSGLRSTGLEEIDVERADLVITLCDEEVCPPLPQTARHLHWPFPDPAGTNEGDDGYDAFRDVRDGLAVRLEHLLS